MDSLYNNITDTDDDNDLVADVDPDTFIHTTVRTELKNGEVLSIDNVHNIILKKAIGTGFLQTFGASLYHITKSSFYSTWLEDSSPLYAHQA